METLKAEASPEWIKNAAPNEGEDEDRDENHAPGSDSGLARA